MILQINPKPWLVFILFLIFLFIIGTFKSHAKPKPKNSFPTIIQSPPNLLKINEGEYIYLLKLRKQLLA